MGPSEMQQKLDQWVEGAKLYEMRRIEYGQEITVEDTRHPSGKPYYICVIEAGEGLNVALAAAIDAMRRARREDPKAQR